MEQGEYSGRLTGAASVELAVTISAESADLEGSNRGMGNGDSVAFQVSGRLLARAFLTLTLTVSGMDTVAACHFNTPSPNSAPNSSSSCAAGMQSYDGLCMSNASISYIECTKDRGFDLSSEVSGGLSGTFRTIVGASVNAAVIKSKREDTPVALQIVKACLTLAEQPTQTTADRQAVQQYTDQVNQTIDQWQQGLVRQTPHITLSKSAAAAGETVTVTGESFWPNETIDIRVHATLVTQVPADGHGDFTVTITVPASGLLVNFPTVIGASGESSAQSADSPFTRTG